MTAGALTPGRALYEAYTEVFAYRWGGHPLSWRNLPVERERELWEEVARRFAEHDGPPAPFPGR